MTRLEQNIIASWNFWEDDDMSTERLLAHICDDCECEVDEVVDVLKKYSVER